MSAELGSPGQVFRRLRARLTVIFLVVAFVGFGLFTTALVLRDMWADAGRTDELLRGEASRAAALVYEGSDGRPTTEAVEGDHVATASKGLLIVSSAGSRTSVLFASGAAPGADWRGLARACVGDPEERGTFADLGEFRAAGMPWWLHTEDTTPSGCAIALTPRPSPADSDVVVPAVLGSAALLLLLTGIVWWSTGRSLRVAEHALGDRERFLATAAHEMRSPLARMRTQAEAALRATPAPAPPTAATLRSLVSTADDAGRVVSNLLLASRIDHAEVPVRTAPVRLDEVAVEVETVIPGVVVDVSEPVEVEGDAMLLRQAMTNLVDNARRHGRVGEEPAQVLLTVECRAGTPVVRVADDGPGLPEGVDVLRPYYVGAGGGTGLGLPLVRWIADRHGAELWLGSAEGRDGLSGAAVELRFTG